MLFYGGYVCKITCNINFSSFCTKSRDNNLILSGTFLFFLLNAIFLVKLTCSIIELQMQNVLPFSKLLLSLLTIKSVVLFFLEFVSDLEGRGQTEEGLGSDASPTNLVVGDAGSENTDMSVCLGMYYFCFVFLLYNLVFL